MSTLTATTNSTIDNFLWKTKPINPRVPEVQDYVNINITMALASIFRATTGNQSMPAAGSTCGAGGSTSTRCLNCLLYTSDAADDTPC
eukprot:5820573-Amphidinium_carterae.2